jgi:hypothetical protein
MHRPSSGRALVLAATLALGLFVGSLVGGTALANHQFSDVGANSEFHDEISWLVDAGVANGYPDGTFRPSQPVSRQAMAAFLARGLAGPHLVSQTTDPPLGSSWQGSATCPQGEEAIAGGGRMDFAEIFLTDSVPNTEEQATAWAVRFESDDNTPLNPTGMTVWALCRPIPFDEITS